MAGRIRSIKPELRETHAFASLSDGAARLFLMLYTLVDDEGRCPASAGYLNGQVFFARPRPANTVGRMLGELERAGLVATYKIGGAAYLRILGWHDKSAVTHQRIEKRQPARYPAPEAIHSRNDSRSDSRPDSGTDLGPQTLDRDRDPERETAPAADRVHRAGAAPPPLSLPVAPREAAEREPAPAPVRATSWQRGDAWWQHMLEAHRRVRARGIEPNAGDPTGTYIAYEREMTACASWLRTAGRDEAGVDEGMRHVALVAEAEAVREGHLRYFKPRLVWDLDRFKRAIDTSLEEATSPRRPAAPATSARDGRVEHRAHYPELDP